MDYWDFAFGWLFNETAWEIISAIMALGVVCGTVLLLIATPHRLPVWLRWIYIPAVLITMYLLVALLAWSGLGLGE